MAFEVSKRALAGVGIVGLCEQRVLVLANAPAYAHE